MSIVYVVSITVAAEVRGGCIREKGNIVIYITGRPRRDKVNVGTDTKGNIAKKCSENRGQIRDPVVLRVSDCD